MPPAASGKQRLGKLLGDRQLSGRFHNAFILLFRAAYQLFHLEDRLAHQFQIVHGRFRLIHTRSCIALKITQFNGSQNEYP